MPVQIDNTSWPVLVTRFTGESSFEDVDGYLRQVEACYFQEEPFAHLVDVAVSFDSAVANMTMGMGSRERRLLGEWMKEHAETIGRVCVGAPYVIRHSLSTR